MNKKIIASTISIVSMVALVGGATYALFTDQAQANDSTFASGEADLQLALDAGQGEPSVFTDSIAAPDFSNLAPGFNGEYTFWLKNVSSSPISLDVVADIADVVENTGGALDDNLLIKWTCDTDDNGGVSDNTPTAEFSVNQWFFGGNAALGTLAPGNAIICRMHARIPSTVGNEIEGDSVTFDVLYDATQTTP